MQSRLFSKKPKVKCVAAHLYDDKIVLFAEDKVKDEFWIYTDHYELLDPNVDYKTLGEKIRFLANHSKVNVRNPKTKEEFKEIGEKLLIAGGFKTQKESRQGKFCNIMFFDEEIEISPTINEGSKGFNYFKAEFRLGINISNNELGQALRSGWKICK